MAEATSDAFLSGQGIPVATGDVAAELTRLWGPAAREAGPDGGDNPTVTRVVLANVVVGVGPGSPGGLDGVLDTVVARYPCRALVACRTEEPARKVAAEVAALCHLPAPGVPQVCSERIVLRAGPDAIDLLPGAIRPLLEANLPFVLWWADDPRASESLFRDLADECSRLILDLPDPAAEPDAIALGLDPILCRFAWDSAWFGITRWRELVAQFFDVAEARGNLDGVSRVEIRTKVPGGKKVPRVAVWLAAWLAGQLGWQAESVTAIDSDGLDTQFQGPRGPIAVRIQSEVCPEATTGEVVAVTLALAGPEGETSYHLTRRAAGSNQVRVNITSPSACALPRVVNAPELDAADRITAALESARLDPPFERARPIALWMLGVGPQPNP